MQKIKKENIIQTLVVIPFILAGLFLISRAKMPSEHQKQIGLDFRKWLDDITVNESGYILNEYKKSNLYVLSKHYDHPQESTVINIYQNIEKIGIWEKIYVENESAGITGRYCYLGYMLTTYKGYYADSFTRNPRTRFTVSIKWNKDGNFECRNAQ